MWMEKCCENSVAFCYNMAAYLEKIFSQRNWENIQSIIIHCTNTQESNFIQIFNIIKRNGKCENFE